MASHKPALGLQEKNNKHEHGTIKSLQAAFLLQQQDGETLNRETAGDEISWPGPVQLAFPLTSAPATAVPLRRTSKFKVARRAKIKIDRVDKRAQKSVRIRQSYLRPVFLCFAGRFGPQRDSLLVSLA